MIKMIRLEFLNEMYILLDFILMALSTPSCFVLLFSDSLNLIVF